MHDSQNNSDIKKSLKAEKAADGEVKFSKKQIEMNNHKITVEMSDYDRSKILKGKTIGVPIYNGESDKIIQENNLSKESKHGLIEAVLYKIAEAFDVDTSSYILNINEEKSSYLPTSWVSKIRNRSSTSLDTNLAQNDSSVNTEFMQDSQNNSDIKKSLKAEDDVPSAIDRYYAEAIRENRAFSQIFALMGDMYST